MKPLLAAATDGKGLRYPLTASPKLDGVRALIIDGVVVSRSLKPIPNKHVQASLGGVKKFNGLDGELIVGPPGAKNVFQKTTSGVMSIEGKPDFKFHVFDQFTTDAGFDYRYNLLGGVIRYSRWMTLVPHLRVTSAEELDTLEARWLAAGYEGVMLRDPYGPYKQGRSTLKEGILIKLKRFADSEAVVVGFTQLMTNTNEAVRNELGHLERSSKKDGMKGAGILGALKVRDMKTGVEFEVGTGYTEEQRARLWKIRAALVGKLLKYKYQPVGVKEKPRFPVFTGFRDPLDT